jgi:hypothetical protein
MGGLIQPSPSTEQRTTNWVPILVGIAAVVAVVGAIALLTREQPKSAATPHPYASNVKLTNVKMSAAQNFVGATVTYIDGTATNTGDKTVIHAMVHVIFRNSLNEVAQAEDIPLHVLQTSGPYPDAVDLNASPLVPEQSKPFRLTFEHITADWNQQYPELQVTDVVVK